MNKDLTTLFTGRRSVILTEVDSTNTLLAKMLKEEQVPEGTAIQALNQIAGRGQAGAYWESEEGKNLLVSYVFYPSFIAPKDVFLINKAFALAICECLSSLINSKLRIKWPNDIYWNDLKIAGLLIENSMSSSTISHCILGIGLNVNQTEFSPSTPNPVSLKLITGENHNLQIVFASLCTFIEARYLQLKNSEKSKIESGFNNVLYAVNVWRQFQTATNTFMGRILYVDENGRLVIEDENNMVHFFNAKEVRFSNV